MKFLGPFATEPQSEDDAYDEWRQEMDDNGLDTGFRGRELWREGLSSKFKEDKVSETSKVKRWCGRAAAGTETAGMNSMVEWHGDPDEDTPYVLASDYDKLERDLRVAEERIAKLQDGTCLKCGGNLGDTPCAYPEACVHPARQIALERNQQFLLGQDNVSLRDGNWLDKHGCCKVCDGEIPDGHTENCDIYKLERELRVAKDHVTLLKAHIAQLTAPGEYARLVTWLRAQRAKLQEVGGWDNELQGIPAGGVRTLIEHGEDSATAIAQLQARVRMAETLLNDAQKRFLAENDALRIRAEQAEARLAECEEYAERYGRREHE